MTHHLLVSHQVHRFGGMKYIYILPEFDFESLGALSRPPSNVPPWHRDVLEFE